MATLRRIANEFAAFGSSEIAVAPSQNAVSEETTSTSSSSTKPESVTEFASLDFGSLLDEVDHLEAEAPTTQQKPQLFAVGDEVSARWHDDDQYYDAVIDALLDGGSYRITFTQYGNSQNTAEIDIRPSASALFVIAERKLALQKAEQKSVEKKKQITLDLKNNDRGIRGMLPQSHSQPPATSRPMTQEKVPQPRRLSAGHEMSRAFDEILESEVSSVSAMSHQERAAMVKREAEALAKAKTGDSNGDGNRKARTIVVGEKKNDDPKPKSPRFSFGKKK